MPDGQSDFQWQTGHTHVFVLTGRARRSGSLQVMVVRVPLDYESRNVVRAVAGVSVFQALAVSTSQVLRYKT
jgi:hypothetical protein